jgi:hypothetical protein
MLKLTALHGWSYTAEVRLEIPSVQPVGRKLVPTVLSCASGRSRSMNLEVWRPRAVAHYMARIFM